MISRFYEQFSQSSRNLGHFGSSKNFKLLEHKYIIYHFEASDLEIPNIQFVSRKIFKFRENKSNNVFREIRKCFRKSAKFEFFAKQIIYLESPDHPLQNDI